MAGRSRMTATAEPRAELRVPPSGADRLQAERARAFLLPLSGWTSSRVAEAFGVQENTVRFWRCGFRASRPDQAQQRLHQPAGASRRPLWAQARPAVQARGEVLDNGPIHTSKLSHATLAARVSKKSANGGQTAPGFQEAPDPARMEL